MQGETLFSESSVSQINQYFVPTEVPTRADLKNYTITIEEEDSSEGFEALERLTSQGDYMAISEKSKKTESIEKRFINTSPIPVITVEEKPTVSVSQIVNTESKTKPAIKRPSKLKYTSNNKKMFERAMSLPTQNVTFANKEKNIREFMRKNDDNDDNGDDNEMEQSEDLFQTNSLQGFYNKSKRGSKSLARSIKGKFLLSEYNNLILSKGKLSQIKSQSRNARENPGKSHFYFLSQSFSETSEPSSKQKLNNTMYSHRGYETSYPEEIIKPLSSQINESPIDSRLNSQLTTKRSSLVDDFKAFKKSVHPPSFNTSFEADDLFHKEPSIENKTTNATGIRNKPKIITSPEPEEIEEVAEVSKTPTKKVKEIC